MTNKQPGLLYCCARQVVVTLLITFGSVIALGLLSGWTQIQQFGGGFIWMGVGVFILGLVSTGGSLVKPARASLLPASGPNSLAADGVAYRQEQVRFAVWMGLAAFLAVAAGLLLRSL